MKDSEFLLKDLGVREGPASNYTQKKKSGGVEKEIVE
jgi:hypothetical protein